MKPIKLSICICSLHHRAQLLHELQISLATQARLDEVQITTAIDAGQTSIGTKRNLLIKASVGEYIVHVDDDDLVHSDYVEDILDAIDRWPGVDVVAIRGRRVEHSTLNDAVRPAPVRDQDSVVFDYRIGGIEGEWLDEMDDRVIWRSPGHVCPVRADLVKSTPFVDVRQAEDLIWNQALAPKLETLTRVSDPLKELYLYRWNPHREPYT